MFRPVSRTWLALDIVGAVIGFGLTVGIPLVPGSGGLSVWIVDGGWSVTAYLVVGAIVWGAAAIARLRAAERAVMAPGNAGPVLADEAVLTLTKALARRG